MVHGRVFQRLFFTCLVLLAVPMRGQPGPLPVETLEAAVARAQSVFIDRIVAVGSGQDPRAPIVFAVEEALKGKPARQMEFAYLPSGPKPVGTRMLLARMDDNRFPFLDVDLSNAPSFQGQAVTTEDCSTLKSAESVIRVAREAARRPDFGTGKQDFEWYNPPDVQRRTGCTAEVLIVPIDAHLERVAQAVLRGDNKDISYRLEAIRALAHFRSNENTGLLKPLLNDPTLGWDPASESRSFRETLGVEYRFYTIRAEAYRTLREWGVDVAKPVLREHSFNPESVTGVDWANNGALATADFVGLLRFPKLVGLGLDNDRLTDADFRAIGRLTTLESLTLDGTNVTDAQVGYLIGLTHLVFLNLYETGVGDEALKTVAALRSLKQVYLTKKPDGPSEAGVAALRKARPDLEIECFEPI